MEDLPNDVKYVIFQALSHPTRVKILALIDHKDLTFGSLKNELGIESSGQLQHHMQKLSSLVTEKDNGSYGLTNAGKRALDIFWESERSGRSVEDLCCLPTPSEVAHDKQISSSGTVLRLAIGSILLALTVAILAVYFVSGQAALTFHATSSSSVSFGGWWFAGVILFGFFGVSFLISAITGFPGCEVTAIPNLFSRKKKMYCSCLITPFNLPNGRLLDRERQ
jgi:DNA-binding transcriptional ArsR family regulator